MTPTGRSQEEGTTLDTVLKPQQVRENPLSLC